MHHQYIDRDSGLLRQELLIQDNIIKFLYSTAREHTPALFRAVTSARTSAVLGYINFDAPFLARLAGTKRFVEKLNINLDECVEPPARLNSPRKVFERQIRYWQTRPMEGDPHQVVSPADAKVLIGSFAEQSSLYLKNKFFDYEELLGHDQDDWQRLFAGGDFAIFRLTPEKYHYNHCPVSGLVVDCYSLNGRFHSCNPQAIVAMATPYSKNRRVVTIIDTDVAGGSQVGLVAMVEVVALMIGDIVQCYSADKYLDPQPVRSGLFVQKGQPKSLYRPGSSTDVLIFQAGRLRFAADLVTNMQRQQSTSRFSSGFGQPLLETDLAVRSTIASRR